MTTYQVLMTLSGVILLLVAGLFFVAAKAWRKAAQYSRELSEVLYVVQRYNREHFTEMGNLKKLHEDDLVILALRLRNQLDNIVDEAQKMNDLTATKIVTAYDSKGD